MINWESQTCRFHRSCGIPYTSSAWTVNPFPLSTSVHIYTLLFSLLKALPIMMSTSMSLLKPILIVLALTITSSNDSLFLVPFRWSQFITLSQHTIGTSWIHSWFTSPGPAPHIMFLRHTNDRHPDLQSLTEFLSWTSEALGTVTKGLSPIIRGQPTEWGYVTVWLFCYLCRLLESQSSGSQLALFHSIKKAELFAHKVFPRV